MLAQEVKKPLELSCTDCFQLLNYDASLLAEGGDVDEILSGVKRHLAICAGCQEAFADWLDKVEKDAGTHGFEGE